MFSPIENRRPILQSKEQVQQIRENSLVTKIMQRNVNKGRMMSPGTNKMRLTSISPSSINNTSHVAKIKERIMRRNNAHLNNTSAKRTAHSTSSSSPMNNVSPQGRLGKFIETIRKKNACDLSSISSQVIHSFTPHSRKKDFVQETPKLEEDIADDEFRADLPQLLKPKTYTNSEELKLRENLICKIKKVCDEFSLSDDTFFRAIFLYDYQERVIPRPNCPRYETMKVCLDEIFTFGESPDNAERQQQYMCFFEMISCLMVAMKFYDFELETPTLRHFLKYFKVGKMNFSSKEDSLDSEKIREIQEIVFETVYEYV